MEPHDLCGNQRSKQAYQGNLLWAGAAKGDAARLLHFYVEVTRKTQRLTEQLHDNVLKVQLEMPHELGVAHKGTLPVGFARCRDSSH